MSGKKITIITLLFCIIVAMCGGVSAVYADSTNNSSTLIDEQSVEGRGLLVAVSIELKGNGNGTVSAIAENRFTLGNTVLMVIVELYASETMPMYYTDMELVASNSTGDLNIFDSISTTASTGGRAKYWCARVQYKKDSDAWTSKETNILYYDASGTVVK